MSREAIFSSPGWLAAAAIVTVGTLASYVLTRVLSAVLPRSRFLDHPNARSSHVVATPRGGGIGLAIVIGVSVLAVGHVDSTTSVVLIFSAAMATVGLIDDARSLPATVRLSAQVIGGATAAVCIVSDIDSGSTGWFIGVALAALWLVGCVNAFNFMDGIDGISAFHGVLAGGWFAYLGYAHDEGVLVLFGLPLLAACLGFLPDNMASRIFLGDVGSYLLGSVIAILGLVAWSEGLGIFAATSPLLLYLADTGSVVARRLATRQHLTLAHREHVYQRVADGGYSHVRVAGATVAVSAVLTVLSGVAEPVTFAAVAAIVLGAYLWLPKIVVPS